MTIQSFIGNQKNLEVNKMFDWKPMQFHEEWRLTLTFKSQIEQFPYGEDNVFTFMLENNSAKRKAISHCYNI